MMELTGQAGELHFTVTVTRKETGKVETFELIGKITEEAPNGSDAQHGSEKRSD